MKSSLVIPMILLVITSCSLLFPRRGEVQNTHYYVLDYAPKVTAERMEQGPWPFRVRLRNFTVTEVFRQNEIIYRESARVMNYYNYELWAVKPEYLVSEMVYQHLTTARLFRDLSKFVEVDDIDYTLSGAVTALEELDSAGGWYSHIALSMQLQDARLRTMVWTRTWDYRVLAKHKTPAAVVDGLSMLLEKIIDEAIVDLDRVMGANH